MKRILAPTLVALALGAVPAGADTTIEYLFTGGYPLSVSADGTVIAGNNTSDYGPFRWTAAEGRVSLGMASAPIVGGGGGTANMSADGTRVASTIVGPDSTYYTAGLWAEGPGWQFVMPPTPPGGGVSDNGMASVWGLSGDGLNVVGLFWRPGGKAHAFRWTQAEGPIDLGSTPNRASRANGVNYSGSVVVGWAESPTYGYRCPAAWIDDQLTVLSPDVIGEVQCSTLSGLVIAGFEREPVSEIREAAVWHRDGNGWGPTEFLGYVPGSSPGYGLNRINGLSADAKLAVGYCSFAGDPYYTTGFVWTDSTGVIDVNVFLADHGILPDPSFSIASLECMTADGTKLVGWGRDVVSPYTVRAFMIHLDRSTLGAPDTNPVPVVSRLVASPNPVRSGTMLSFELTHEVDGSLTILDASGRMVRSLASGPLAAGTQRIAWDGRDDSGSRVAAGVYFAKLDAGTQRAAGRLVVVD